MITLLVIVYLAGWVLMATEIANAFSCDMDEADAGDALCSILVIAFCLTAWPLLLALRLFWMWRDRA